MNRNKVGLMIAMSLLLCSCNNDAAIREKFKTPEEYRCSAASNRDLYSIDSIFFTHEVQRLIDDKEDPYQGSAYNESTQIYIDTILFDDDRKYCALFTILKCYDELYAKRWAYDGVVHFAHANEADDSLRWSLFAYHGAIHVNAENYAKISDILRFHNLAGRSYEGYLKKTASFNLDDCRFWRSTEFTDTIQSQGFYE